LAFEDELGGIPDHTWGKAAVVIGRTAWGCVTGDSAADVDVDIAGGIVGGTTTKGVSKDWP